MKTTIAIGKKEEIRYDLFIWNGRKRGVRIIWQEKKYNKLNVVGTQVEGYILKTIIVMMKIKQILKNVKEDRLEEPGVDKAIPFDGSKQIQLKP